MAQKLTRYLEELWLSENDAEVYLTLLRLWSAVVWTISKECDIPRATTYQILDRLTDEGLVLKIDKWNVMTYFPEEPNRLIQNLKKESQSLEKKTELAEKLLPHLENLKNPYKQKPKVTYFEWIDWYKELLWKALSTAKSTIRMITSSNCKRTNIEESCKHEELVAFEEKEFHKERLARNLDIKLITTKTELWDYNKESDLRNLRETRFLPDGFWETETLIVFWNSTIIITDNFPIIWVHIEEEQTATMMKNMFSFLWESSK